VFVKLFDSRNHSFKLLGDLLLEENCSLDEFSQQVEEFDILKKENSRVEVVLVEIGPEIDAPGQLNRFENDLFHDEIRNGAIFVVLKGEDR
jgi:hypothetical protein